MRLIDIGANLANRSFRSDLAEVIERAVAAEVDRIVVTGTSAQMSAAACDLAEAYPGVLWSTVGVHPHHAKDYTPEVGQGLRDLTSAPAVVAVGECGLDYNRDLSPRQDQRRAFEAQLELAAEARLPVFLHQRDAHDDFVAILAEHRSALRGAVAHCFTGTAAELDTYLELDLHIGITGWICDERRGRHLQEIVGRIPPSQLMVETDAPYLLPRDLDPRPKNRRNEPAFLPHVLRRVATCLGRDPEAVADETTATAVAFFGLAD